MSSTVRNVARHLRAQASLLGSASAIAVQQRSNRFREISFAELEQRSNDVANGLLAQGLEPGQMALVMVRPGVELITLTYALFKSGVVPVLIDPGMGLGGFLSCVERTRPDALIGIPLAHAASFAFPSAFASLKARVTVGARFGWGGETLDGLARLGASSPAPLHSPESNHEAAAVLFTSGSTGPAKGVVYTHEHFEAQLELLGRTYSFAVGEVDLAAFPLFSLFDNAFGMTSVIPDLDPSRPGNCKPERVVRALLERHCTTAFGSPAIWRRVAPWCAAKGIRLPSLKRVLIAGASVPPGLIASLHRVIAPDGDVETPYGATECLPVASVKGREIVEKTAPLSKEGAGTCVGRVIPGVEIRILRIQDDPVARWDDRLLAEPGEVGEIVVKGPVVTREYHHLPQATASAKIAEGDEGDEIWHRMGDLGRFDEQGRLWFCGRKAERVETATGPWFTDLVEGRAAADPRVSRVALVGVGARGSEAPVLIVEGREDAALARDLAQRTGVRAVLFKSHFPVDVRHNAKIHRLKLKSWAESRLKSSRDFA